MEQRKGIKERTSNANADQESICSKSSEHSLNTSTRAIGSSRESGKDNEDDGREEEGVLARPFIARVTKDQLANNLYAHQ